MAKGACEDDVCVIPWLAGFDMTKLRKTAWIEARSPVASTGFRSNSSSENRQLLTFPEADIRTRLQSWQKWPVSGVMTPIVPQAPAILNSRAGPLSPPLTTCVNAVSYTHLTLPTKRIV